VLRTADGPVPAALLDAAWAEPRQRGRALDSLVADGLVDPLPDGRFALPGALPAPSNRDQTIGVAITTASV
jgi:A/G-specific adenine glycosylase